MGYLDSLIDPSFKKLEDGKTAFFPSGILARGRILPDEQFETTIRRQLRKGYIWGFTSLLVLFAVGRVVSPRWGMLVPFSLIPFWLAWYQIAVVGKLRELPFSSGKLTLRESAARQGMALGWVWLGLLTAFSVFAFTFSSYSLVAAGELQLVPALAVFFFGVCTLFQVYLVVLKLKGRLRNGA